MPQLPSLPTPEWLSSLTEQSIASDPFPLHHILQDSLYYPSSAFDGDPVKHLAGKAYSFIYVDYGHTPADLAQALKNPGFKGYRILGQRSVTERELTPHGWTPVPPPPSERRSMPSNVKPPFCSWVVLENKETNPPTSGVARFSLLYLCADGAAAYQALYTANGHHPKFVCVIQPGTSFGFNWTNFEDPDQILARSVKTNPSGTPPYLLFGGIGPKDFYLKPCWPEYPESLGFYQKAGDGTVGVWGK